MFRCVICGDPAVVAAPAPTACFRHLRSAAEQIIPPVQLCGEHWKQYRTDWLLLGWCGAGHYAEALGRCPRHGQHVEPL